MSPFPPPSKNKPRSNRRNKSESSFTPALAKRKQVQAVRVSPDLLQSLGALFVVFGTLDPNSRVHTTMPLPTSFSFGTEAFLCLRVLTFVM